MASNQVAAQGVPSKTILSRLQAKLRAALIDPFDGAPVDPGFVRVIARPNPGYANFRPEAGVALAMHSPNPRPLSGAGRAGFLIDRTVEVHVCTVNHLDPAGAEDLLVAAHLDVEDQVLDTLIPGRAQAVVMPTVPEEQVGVTVKFVPGGADIERQVRIDPGMAFSVLLFEVAYAAPVRVYRD